MNIKIGRKVKLLKKFDLFNLNNYIRDTTSFSYHFVYLSINPNNHAPGIIYSYEEEICKIALVEGKKFAFTKTLIIDLENALKNNEIKITDNNVENKESKNSHRDFIIGLNERFENWSMGLITKSEFVNSIGLLFMDFYKIKFSQEILIHDAIEARRISNLKDEDFFNETWKRFVPKEKPYVNEKQFEEMKLIWYFVEPEKYEVENNFIHPKVYEWVDNFISVSIKNGINKFTRIDRFFSGLYLTRKRFNSDRLTNRPYINIQFGNIIGDTVMLNVSWQGENSEKLNLITSNPWEDSQFKSVIQKLKNSPIY